MQKLVRFIALVLISTAVAWAQAADEATVLAGTARLEMQGDLSAQMVAGIDKFLMRETQRSVAEREKHWQRDFTSAVAYERSVQPNRERLRKIIGAVDPRVPGSLEFVSDVAAPGKIAETEAYTIYAVRWPVLEGC